MSKYSFPSPRSETRLHDCSDTQPPSPDPYWRCTRPRILPPSISPSRCHSPAFMRASRPQDRHLHDGVAITLRYTFCRKCQSFLAPKPAPRRPPPYVNGTTRRQSPSYSVVMGGLCELRCMPSGRICKLARQGLRLTSSKASSEDLHRGHDCFCMTAILSGIS